MSPEATTHVSKYAILLRAIELGSFTRVAQELGYTQSAVSQTIRNLERELGCTLVERGKGGVTPTKDGRAYLPFVQAIVRDEEALANKRRELMGLEHATVSIGTFTSVSRNLLPQLMRDFREEWPGIRFVLRQGEYTSIGEWIHSGECDLGFTNHDHMVAGDLEGQFLQSDHMMAVLPKGHPLTRHAEVTLEQLAHETLIQLDEGQDSILLRAFEDAGLEPNVAYKVTDDYTILSMVRQNLGVAILYQLMLVGFEKGVEVRPIVERPKRSISLAWSRRETLPLAASRFADFTIDRLS